MQHQMQKYNGFILSLSFCYMHNRSNSIHEASYKDILIAQMDVLYHGL